MGSRIREDQRELMGSRSCDLHVSLARACEREGIRGMEIPRNPKMAETGGGRRGCRLEMEGTGDHEARPYRSWLGEGGMGPRIREETREGSGFPPASSRGRAVSGGEGDGSPHPRGEREGSGLPFSSSRGQAVSGGKGMGPRIREENGRGVGCRFRLHGGRL